MASCKVAPVRRSRAHLSLGLLRHLWHMSFLTRFWLNGGVGPAAAIGTIVSNEGGLNCSSSNRDICIIIISIFFVM
jgi:hypothetical protein